MEVRSLCAIREELAYRSASADSIFAVQGLGSHPVLLAAEEELRRSLLPAVAEGSALFAFALTEPDAGSDLSALSCSARRSGDHYVLNGAKRFISNAGIASHYTLFARTGEGSGGLSTFVVPSDSPGLRIVLLRLLGEHSIGDLVLEECRIPSSLRVGPEGNGMRLALSTLDFFRSTVGASAVGMARRALDEAVAYAKRRHQFGGPLASLQGVQFPLAESSTEIDAARLLVQRAAAKKDEGAARITYEAAAAKLFATEAAQRAIDSLPSNPRRQRPVEGQRPGAPVPGRPRPSHLRGRVRGPQGGHRPPSAGGDDRAPRRAPTALTAAGRVG